MSPPPRERRRALAARLGPRQRSVLAWIHLARIYHKVQQRTGQHLRRFGLTTAQFDVLAQVGAREGCTQQELADELGMSQMHVSRLERSALLQLRTSLCA